MPSKKAIKHRIASVGTTEQIMKAMGMVAASKLQRAKTRLDSSRLLFNETSRMITGLAGSESVARNIYFQTRKVKNTAYIVVTSDRGLCGGYNLIISEKTLAHMNDGKNEKIISIGLKGREFFQRRGKNVLHRYSGLLETVLYQDAEEIGGLLVSMYVSGEIDEAYIAYTRFDSALSYTPLVAKVLPVSRRDTDAAEKSAELKYEPDTDSFLDLAIPIYLNAFIYAAMVESAACEQASRMVSMDSASSNANEIIDKLTLMYNRKRQASITQEISEIVGSANMLE